jgi:hypothetical protein
MAQAPESTPESAQEALPEGAVAASRTKTPRWLVLLGCAVLGLIVAYTLGYMTGRHSFEEDTVAPQVQKLEARRQLHLAIVALEERNFGTAQARLQTAGGLLVDGSLDAGWNELGQQVKGYKLLAGEDLAKERQALTEFVSRADAFIAPTGDR